MGVERLTCEFRVDFCRALTGAATYGHCRLEMQRKPVCQAFLESFSKSVSRDEDHEFEPSRRRACIRTEIDSDVSHICFPCPSELPMRLKRTQIAKMCTWCSGDEQRANKTV